MKTPKNQDLVSVIITAFNEEKFISQALDSFLCQSYDNLEIIVVNDGSTDNTKAILDNYALQYPSIKAIHFDINKGKASAQNYAFGQASGSFIAVSGGDDYAVYSRIKTQVDYITKNQLSIVYTNLYMVDENNNCFVNKPILLKDVPKPIDLKRVLFGGGFSGNSILFTRELANDIYPIPDNLSYEDLWFNFISVIHGKIGYLHEPLGFYRQSPQNSYGLYTQKTFNQFKNRYLSLRKRLLPYLEEMKKYLINHNLWNVETEVIFEKSKDVLMIELEDNFLKRIDLWLGFIWKNKSSLTFKEISLLFPDILIFLRLCRTKI